MRTGTYHSEAVEFSQPLVEKLFRIRLVVTVLTAFILVTLHSYKFCGTLWLFQLKVVRSVTQNVSHLNFPRAHVSPFMKNNPQRITGEEYIFLSSLYNWKIQKESRDFISTIILIGKKNNSPNCSRRVKVSN